MAAPGLPRPAKSTISKLALLRDLKAVDDSKESRKRVLTLETDFRQRIDTHVSSLPTNQACFAKFNTNPFVLMFHCFNRGYHHISEIEADILPAKVFMSMETSSGRMAETVALPVYDWETVPSSMHSAESVLDGKQRRPTELRLATLKSGPRCLNDEMSKDIADDIILNCNSWAKAAKVTKIDFTYGVLYGTKKLSNKKDWHILRNIKEKLEENAAGNMIVTPENRWHCQFKQNGVNVTVTIRIGIDLWNYIAGHTLAFMELCTALIRACVISTNSQSINHNFTIADLADIVSLRCVPDDFNVSILQRSQLEWLFFFARHFCDELVET
ncbi:MAG: PmeII family type II restriction endonuclease [Planctomycetia bacterium]|jgi:hypothetical protein